MSSPHPDHLKGSDYPRQVLTIGLLPRHREEFDKLCRALKTASGFQLIILQFNDPLYRDNLIKRINQFTEKSCVLTVSPSDFPSFSQLRQRLSVLSKDYQVIHLINMESLFPPENPSPVIEGFNSQREALARDCGASLLLWMTEPDIKTFAVRAPDMWAWRSAVLSFEREKKLLKPEIPPLSESRSGLSMKKRIDRINEIQDYLSRGTEGVSDRSSASLHNEIGLLFLDIGKYEEALKHLEKSLRIIHEIGDQQGEGTTLNNIGSIYQALGKYREALKCLLESLRITRELGDRRGEGTTLNNIGAIYQAWGKYEKALEYLLESLQIRREVGDHRGEGATLNNISQIYDSWGKYKEALEYLQESLSIAREVGDRRDEGTTLNNIGAIYQAWGKYEKALEYLLESLQIRREVGDRQGEGATLNNISQIYDSWGKSKEALEYLQESLSIAREVGDRYVEGTTLNNIAQIYSSWGKYEKALSRLIECLQISREMGDRQGEGMTLWNMAMTLYEGDIDKAFSYFEQALEVMKEIHSPDYEKYRQFVETLKEGTQQKSGQ